MRSAAIEAPGRVYIFHLFSPHFPLFLLSYTLLMFPSLRAYFCPRFLPGSSSSSGGGEKNSSGVVSWVTDNRFKDLENTRNVATKVKVRNCVSWRLGPVPLFAG